MSIFRSAVFTVWFVIAGALVALVVVATVIGGSPDTVSVASPVARTVDSCVRPLLSVRDTFTGLTANASNPVMLPAAAQATSAAAKDAAERLGGAVAVVLNGIASSADQLASNPADGVAQVRHINTQGDIAAALCVDPTGPVAAVVGNYHPSGDTGTNDTGTNDTTVQPSAGASS